MMTTTHTPANPITYRADYTPPNYWVDTVDMSFDLHPTHTHIRTRSVLRHRTDAPNTLVWAGEAQLDSVAVNGHVLAAGDYSVANDTLTIPNMPAAIDAAHPLTIDIATTVNPTANTSLMGLYASQGNLFTQCEAEGFRRMTYAADRPDVMSRYTVRLQANKAQYPVLLANGNLIASGDLDGDAGNSDGRHYAVWQDPHLKPCYLFAIVAGNLLANEVWIDNPHVQSGRSLLQIYTRPADQAATQWALDSLKASIDWDLHTFGRPLDLERYMVVAVGDFNMGAMENKGLNVFNTAYVLAQPSTATDTDYGNIEGVIGHEYFHNWTGNRITCRDWFQLTLKEGLTVYRDQCFSADMAAGFGGTALSASAKTSAKAVRRIDDVATLRTAQFGEDAGPMAHPVRPDSFADISNFYTATVYEKGAEVIRMQALLANTARPNGFRLGMDTYFARHDGQAVTCDDFITAISDGSGADLSQFKRWYEQAGTPTVQASGSYNAALQQYTLTVSQSNPPVGIEKPDSIKPPLHIPVLMGLLSSSGAALRCSLHQASATEPPATEHLLHLTQTEQAFVFDGVVSEPIPSLLRGFSAPVKLQFDYSDADLALLLDHDVDAFNRWEAAQRLYERLIVAEYQGTPNLASSQVLHTAISQALNDVQLAPAFKAVLLSAPSYNTLLDSIAHDIRPQALFAARESVLNHLATALVQQWPSLYADLNRSASYSPDATQAGDRALRNAVLMLWLRTGDATAFAAAQAQYAKADNMTNRMAALSGLLHHGGHQYASELADFYTRFADNDLVIDKWFALQATLPHATLAQLQALLQHSAFTWTTPNRMRAVVFRVCMANPQVFHTPQGYAFWLTSLEKLIAVNPDVAARLARSLDAWQRYEQPLASVMQAVLQQAAALPNLPKGVTEVLGKALAQARVHTAQ